MLMFASSDCGSSYTHLVLEEQLGRNVCFIETIFRIHPLDYDAYDVN